jgi:hypothetical protein
MDQLPVPAVIYFPAKVIDIDIDNVGEPVEVGIRPDIIGDGCPGQ